MLGSIIFFGVILFVLGVYVIAVSKYKGGYSVEYYKYLENNKVPPPKVREDEERLWRVR